jgi:hypothetical protein
VHKYFPEIKARKKTFPKHDTIFPPWWKNGRKENNGKIAFLTITKRTFYHI